MPIAASRLIAPVGMHSIAHLRRVRAHPHDGPLAAALLDLRDRQAERLLLVVLHRGDRHGSPTPRSACGSARNDPAELETRTKYEAAPGPVNGQFAGGGRRPGRGGSGPAPRRPGPRPRRSDSTRPGTPCRSIQTKADRTSSRRFRQSTASTGSPKRAPVRALTSTKATTPSRSMTRSRSRCPLRTRRPSVRQPCSVSHRSASRSPRSPSRYVSAVMGDGKAPRTGRTIVSLRGGRNRGGTPRRRGSGSGVRCQRTQSGRLRRPEIESTST